MAVPHFLRTFNVPYSYLYRTSYAVTSLFLALVGITLYIHKATILSLVTAASFQVFFCQYVYKLTVWYVVDILARSVLIAAILQLSHHSILLFSRAMAIAVSPLLFTVLLGLLCHSLLLSAICNSSCHFYCHASFITAVHFIAVQPAISRLFIQDWTLSCRFCSGPIVAIFILRLKTFSL